MSADDARDHATAAQVRRIGDQLGVFREDFVHHVADVKMVHEGQNRDLTEIRQVLAAGATAQIERTAIEQERRAEESQRTRDDADRRAKEVAASAEWWTRVTTFLREASENWLVRVVVLALLIAAVPETRGFIDRLLGVTPAPASQTSASASTGGE